jgi:hypothetical protein
MSELGSESECAYPLNDPYPLDCCGAPVKPGSPYCREHHRVCYLPRGSRRESTAVKHIDHMADLAARRRAPRPEWLTALHGEVSEPALHGPATGGSARRTPAEPALSGTAPLPTGSL